VPKDLHRHSWMDIEVGQQGAAGAAPGSESRRAGSDRS
jgi:hypothetical protein